MRVYDIDITLHIRCPAYNKSEALKTVIDQFDDGAYNDHTAIGFEVSKCEEVVR